MWSKKFLFIAIVITIAAIFINLTEAYFWKILPIATDMDDGYYDERKSGFGIVLYKRYSYPIPDPENPEVSVIKFDVLSLISDFGYVYFGTVMVWALLGLGKEAVKDITNFGKEDES